MVVLAAKVYKMKTIIVTGGSQGIGLAIAEKFLATDYQVITISRANKIVIKNKNHYHYSADLSNWSECLNVCEAISQKFLNIDVLVNNVGKSQWSSIENITEDFVNEIFETNIKSYIAITKGILPLMKRNTNIINISSMAAKRGSKNNSIYSASKFAINGLTQSWAKELGSRGIRVNAICPVLVESEGLYSALVLKDAPAEINGVESFMEDFKKTQTALGYLPLAIDVANFCATLIHNRTLTGQCINLDSGVFPQ
jgi:meso-butanediol dehydrogenase/(S,S)-butanediol dehydrogenase/diacetyl reductase